MLLLRTVAADGRGRAGFTWPTTGPVEMRPGSWFGGLLWGQGTARQLAELRPDDVSMVWQLVRVEPEDTQGEVVARRGEVVFAGDRAGAIDLLARHAPAGLPIPWTTVEVGDGGVAVVGPYGTARVGVDGYAVAGECGHAIAGPRSAAAADEGGRITLTSPDGFVTLSFRVGALAESRRLYWLDGDGWLSAGPRVLLDEQGWFRMQGEQVVRLVTSGAGEAAPKALPSNSA